MGQNPVAMPVNVETVPAECQGTAGSGKILHGVRPDRSQEETPSHDTSVSSSGAAGLLHPFMDTGETPQTTPTAGQLVKSEIWATKGIDAGPLHFPDDSSFD